MLLGPGGVRLPVPLRVVPGTAPQAPHQEVQHPAASYPDLAEIRVLALFVIVLPMTIVNEVGMGDPFFCKYLCPAGILEAVFPWPSPMPASGPAWADCSPGRAASCWGWSRWRFFATAPSASGSAPWGRSTACSTGSPSAVWRSTPANALPAGHAARPCKMDVEVFRTPNHSECIRCGDCVAACPHGAITRTFSLKPAQKTKETIT